MPAQCRWASLRHTDFPAALAAAVRARSEHFVVQHVAAVPASAVAHRPDRLAAKISTDPAPIRNASVDIFDLQGRHWLGLVIPKRYAKRAATRNLLKRQIREQLWHRREDLPAGQWVVRLKAPFSTRSYPSAASQALRQAARSELSQVFDQALAP